jgi:tyrosyl-tRNA synthetase
MKSYLKQIGQIIDLEKAEIRYNSEWLKKLEFIDIIELASEFKVAQMLERDNFRLRYEAGKPVGLQEFLYPVMQGYDSVALHADVELGGNDQLFNMMAGRTLQKRAGQKPQAVLVTQLLVGTDGRKMSKTQPNCVFVTDAPVEMYGKLMAIDDELIPEYYRLATAVPMDVIESVEGDMARGANPRDTKASLAREIVARYHGEKVARAAEEAWEKQFRDGGMPDDIPVYRADDKELADVVGLLANAFGVTKSEVRRLLEQGGVRIDGEVVESLDTIRLRSGQIAQLGKGRYIKVQV